MRLTGSSFAERAEGRKMQQDDFKTVIPEAVRLLKGEVALSCLESDELRERLLAGYRYILVDEYQDIDADQYRLISALAGRTLNDPDSKLALLVVGDDDQNIYTFRGANVEFIRRFQIEYQAGIHYLVENYRSTAHIIAAANALISHNRDRMKIDTDIRINKGRELLPPGGPWQAIDPMGRGRVQRVHVTDAAHQTVALVEELLRLRQRHPALPWTDCAVLARTREELAPVRACCEQRGIPVIWGIDRDKTPPLYRLREIRQFFAELKSRHDELLAATDLLEIMNKIAGDQGMNPWWELLQKILAEWRDESGNAQQSPGFIIEYIYESLAEQKRDQAIGAGVFLSTVHAAKGMEFSHVLVPGGGWRCAKNPAEQEEERRAYYVAMTRARETLCLFERQDVPNSHAKLLTGNFLVDSEPPPLPLSTDEKMLRRRYGILGMEDLFLDYAGHLPANDAMHQRLTALKPGDPLRAAVKGNHIELHDAGGRIVARLSRSACETWKGRLPAIERITVLAMVQRLREDSDGEYKQRCRCDQWEIPLAEIAYLSK
jgi:ATP-dependent DNA helicase RecQ